MFTQELVNITIDHYCIERGLARGGMSEVYLARDLQHGHQVAMKMVKRSAGEYYERFRREAKAMMRLHQEHILPALDTGIYSNWAYMVTPYISGGTLTQSLTHGPLPLNHAMLLLDQIAGALQFAHNQGILHRDIKSSNVLLRDPSFAYLTDFGLVKSSEDEFSLTRSGFLIGTPEYMAPELIEADASPASDIYALGILVYQMITGRLPFRGPNPVAIVMKHLNEWPVPPSRLNPAISPDVERVVLQTLDKDPQRRFRTALAFSNAFSQAYTGVSPVLPAATSIPLASVETAIPSTPFLLTPPARVNVVPQNSVRTASNERRVSPPLNLNLRTTIIVGIILLVLILLLWIFISLLS